MNVRYLSLQRAQHVALILLLSVLTACTGDSATDNGNGLLVSSGPTQKHRVIAVLGLMADVNFNLIAPSEEALAANTAKIASTLSTNANLRAYVGDSWRVVWGPVLSNSPKKDKDTGAITYVTDNAMYVAKGQDATTGRDMYVVAVAGTNVVSKKGWLVEDFNVFEKVDWPTPGSGQISAGTHAGLAILMAMKDTVTGKTLTEFLGNLPKDAPVEVASTGHSLGGALSPALALALIEWKEKNALNHITVSVYPLAGATPGDAAFATYAATKFGDRYFSVINRYDIVPNSWQKDMFERIPTLYRGAAFNNGAGFAFPSELLGAYEAVRVAVQNKGYTRIAVDKEFVFSGTPNTYTPESPGGFFPEAGYQHINAYLTDGLSLPQPVIEAVLNLFKN